MVNNMKITKLHFINEELLRDLFEGEIPECYELCLDVPVKFENEESVVGVILDETIPRDWTKAYKVEDLPAYVVEEAVEMLETLDYLTLAEAIAKDYNVAMEELNDQRMINLNLNIAMQEIFSAVARKADKIPNELIKEIDTILKELDEANSSFCDEE